MVISSVSAGLVQEARRFSTENQSRLERTTESRLRTERRDFVTETSQTDSVSEPDRIVSIAEYLAPDSPEVQEQLSSLAPALNAPINEQSRMIRLIEYINSIRMKPVISISLNRKLTSFWRKENQSITQNQ